MAVNKSRKVKIQERRDRVAQLLKARVSYREIAAACQCSLGTVAKDVKILMAQWREHQLENVEEMALLDLASIDDGLRVLTPAVRGGELPAIDRFVRLLERRARILGYEAPTKQHHSHEGFADVMRAICEEEDGDGEE